MADFALTSLQAKLSLLILRQDLKSQPKVADRVEYIRREVKRIQNFLREAEAMGEESNLEQEIWIKRVRDSAYESEDSIDEFLLQLETKYSTVESYSCCSFLSSPIKTTVTPSDIVLKVKHIKAMFIDLSEKNLRYRYMYGPRSEQSIAQPETSILVATGEKDENLTISKNLTESYQEEEYLIGAQKSKKQLLDLLVTDDPTLKVIPVIGMGGLGKTTLVKQVYDDSEIRKQFQTHAWIYVSPTYETVDLLGDLIQQLFKEVKHPVPNLVGMDVMTLAETVLDFLRHRRYMIILDDVWGVNAWNEIRYAFPEDRCGSRVVITTRDADVASASCTSKEHICNLEPLSEEESWTLFRRKTFDGGPCPPNLVGVSKSILQKCAGFPLAILTISGVLITRDKTSASWGQINNRLGGELEDKEALKSTYKILSLSYNNLPYYLRPCFLYTCIFDEDCHIARTKLIRLWIAEGFVDGTNENTPEEVAESYLNELLNRSLMEVAERTTDGRVKKYRIHDLLRQIIIRKSWDQNFALIATENGGSLPENARRLSVHYTLQNVRNQNFNQLRSLLMFGVEEPLPRSSMPMLLAGGCKLLTVLDLEGTTLSKFPTIIVKLLNLRYLSLRSTKVKNIPKSIGILTKLQTLDLKRTRVSRLPIDILKLKSLRNLLVYRYKMEHYATFNSKYGVKAPEGIGGLTFLQKLCFVEGGPGKKATLKDLEMLTKLRRLGIINLINKNCETLCNSIDNLSKLRALSVNSSRDGILSLEKLKLPPSGLRRLYLTGKLESIPIWISSLQHLVKIFLKLSKLLTDPLETLQHLPNLVHIQLLQAYNGSMMWFQDGKFQNLKILGIHEFEFLEEVKFEGAAALNLEQFIIEGCGMLKTVPSGIQHLLKLKDLHLISMPQELITKIHPPPKDGEQYHTVRHIPEITATDMVDGKWEMKRLTTTNQQSPSLDTGTMNSFRNIHEK